MDCNFVNINIMLQEVPDKSMCQFIVSTCMFAFLKIWYSIFVFAIWAIENMRPYEAAKSKGTVSRVRYGGCLE